METFRAIMARSVNFDVSKVEGGILSVGNNLWKRVGQKFSRRSLGSRLKGSIFFFFFCRYFIGITKESIGRMKGVTRFECCSCWPEMIDRGALLAGTDLPLPVALPLLPRTGSWQLETPRYFFLRNDGYFYIVWNFSGIDFVIARVGIKVSN